MLKTLFKKKERLRKKKVFYFSRPFSNCVKTDMGKEFLKIFSKHFPKTGTYGKFFNRNTIKISYSCMPNLEKEKSKHLLNFDVIDDNNRKLQNKSNCPVNGKCLTKGVIYKATVTHNNKNHIYIGSTVRV